MAKKYNPYEDVKKISELKGSYHTAKEKGQDPTQYAQEAVQYYQNLRDNGKGDVADKLAGVDYTGSLEILKGYNAPTEYDWYDNLVGQKIEEASKPVRSETVDQIMAVYNKNNDLLNGDVRKDANGNVVSGLNVDYYNTGKGQLDYINNLDMTKQPWYENLMAQYQLGGQNAAKGALATGAAGNSGNIDSYAAANANRQQLAFTTAGTQAALDTIAQQLAAYQNMYDSIGAHLGTMGAQNNDALNIGSQYYQIDSSERQNALNQAAAMERAKYQAQIDELVANITGETSKYQADKTLEGTKYGADIDLQGAQYKADQALQEAYAQAAADRYKADKTYEADMAEIEAAKKEAVDEEAAETEPLNGLYADLHELYNMFRSKQNGITSLSDVYQAAVGLHPEYEQEIRNYINNLNKLTSGTSGYTLNTGN
ncbi:MAG: hypothetical protein IJB52_10270 [Clostridia bacterium]|nr:hypothetical protein [Clostridia bacterium]